MKAYIIHENDDWLPPLRHALDERGVPYAEWFIHTGHFDIQAAPPEGVYFNRMSASSHTRGHVESVDYTRQLLAWLERHNRRVLNGSAAFELEMSKVRQYAALEAFGIRTPHTQAVIGGADELLDAADQMETPFITKHNRGGKGLGVQLFRSHDAFRDYVASGDLEPSPDHVMLLQQYIQAKEPFITRCEFVGDDFLYAIKADTSEGFELCPAEACRIDERCAIDGEEDRADDAPPLFSLRHDVAPGLIDQYRRFLNHSDIDVAGIEFIEDEDGTPWTYDINGTTNYSPDVEAAHDVSGMGAVADLMQRELDRLATAREPVPSPS